MNYNDKNKKGEYTLTVTFTRKLYFYDSFDFLPILKTQGNSKDQTFLTSLLLTLITFYH